VNLCLTAIPVFLALFHPHLILTLVPILMYWLGWVFGVGDRDLTARSHGSPGDTAQHRAPKWTSNAARVGESSMVKSKPTSYLVGVATLWPIVYFVGFVTFTFITIINEDPSESDDAIPSWFIGLAALHLLSMAITLAVLVVYLIDVFRNPDLHESQDRRTMWVVLIVVVAPFATPVYWWMFLRPASASFRRRLHESRQSATSSSDAN